MACFNTCNYDAIDITTDESGFYKIKRNSNCIGCNQCFHVCPVINPIVNNNNKRPIIFIGKNRNNSIREKSSSGGIFHSLAKANIDNGGVVYGAAFSKEKLEHKRVSTIDQLELLIGSKYIQSDIGNSLRMVKNDISHNIPVLFAGTPCQIAGLYAHLGYKPPNLTTIDLVCHGVSSRYYLNEYISKHIPTDMSPNDFSILFREKSNGWRNYSIVIINSNKEVIHSISFRKSSFFLNYLSNQNIRESCKTCNFCSNPRIADITLGDFWGIEKITKKNDDNKGVSLVISNSHQGSLFLRNISKDLTIIKNPDYSMLFNYNPSLIFPSISYDKINNSTNAKSISNSKNVLMMNLAYTDNNYGAVLVTYALQEIIKKIGYIPKTLNFNPFTYPSIIKKKESASFYRFREKYIDMTSVCNTPLDFTNLIDSFNIFLTGSDQVWRRESNIEMISAFYLKWVPIQKKIISYAPSFGVEYWEGNKESLFHAKQCLSRFDHISIRELGGKALLENFFNIQATHVLDPVLLADKDIFEKLIEDEPPISNYIACYLLNDSHNKDITSESIVKISKSLQLPVINIKGNKSDFYNYDFFQYNTISKWLTLLKYSKYLITDSYHGILFSILYNIPFIYINREIGGNDRIKSIEEIFDFIIPKVKTIHELSTNLLKTETINFNLINNKLTMLREKSLKYLVSSLQSEKELSLSTLLHEVNLLSDQIYYTNQTINNLKSRLNKAENNIFRRIYIRLQKTIPFILLKLVYQYTKGIS